MAAITPLLLSIAVTMQPLPDRESAAAFWFGVPSSLLD
jgi:hypothetical protein